MDTVFLFFIFHYAWVYRQYFKRCQLAWFCRWCLFLLLKNSRVISFFLVLGKFTIIFLDMCGIFILGFRELFLKIWIFYPLLKCAGFFFFLYYTHSSFPLCVLQTFTILLGICLKYFSWIPTIRCQSPYIYSLTYFSIASFSSF